MTTKEAVQHPKHYNQGTLEVWDVTTDWNLNFLEGNIVKYVARHRTKNGLQDLLKARQYLDKLIDVETDREARLAAQGQKKG